MAAALKTNSSTFFVRVVGLGLLLSTPFIFAVSGVHWDDAYIFFRYAHNLAEGRGLTFNIGDPSIGVTSILWTLLLALLEIIFGAAAVPATAKVLGAVLYALSAGLWSLVVAESAQRPWIGIATGLLIAGNPLGVTLAVSGMDTALSILLLTGVFFCFHRCHFQRPLLLGVLMGLFFLTRPDAVVLWVTIAIVFTVAILNQDRRTSLGCDVLRWTHTGLLIVAGAMLMAIPWAIVVYDTSGHWVPPTQIGKMLGRLPSEHGVTYPQFLQLDLASRFVLAAKNIVTFFGLERGGASILPFCLALMIGAPSVSLFRNINDQGLWIGLWVYAVVLILTFSFLFPLPMPRYIATIIPVSIAGSLLLIHHLPLSWLDERMRRHWAPAFGHGLLSACLWIVFGLSILGPLAITYPAYVAKANEQQLRRAVGEWIRDNTPAHAVIALEPIGEIGFYSERKVVDLGGLISPGVWGYIGNGYDDAERMFEFLRKHHVQYLIDRPLEIDWSLKNTVDEFQECFTLRASFGLGDNKHLIYELREEGQGRLCAAHRSRS